MTDDCTRYPWSMSHGCAEGFSVRVGPGRSFRFAA